MNKHIEILQITQEECAEVIQSISKCFRFGIDNKFSNYSIDNREKLTEELGDLLCMIDLLTEHQVVDINKLEYYKTKKREKLANWSSIFN